MAVEPVEISRAIEGLRSDQLVLFDVRSPSEFMAGHILGAINMPLLNDDERKQVGIEFKHKGQQDAVKLGFDLVGGRFGALASEARRVAGEKQAMVYCWRGGMRSSIVAWIFDLAGIRVAQLQGGYKAWRGWCYERFENPGTLLLLSGMTGTGKTEILHELVALGEPVLDLEKIAHHKGSVFGGLGQESQPTQEHFENELGWMIGTLNESGPIWVEDESRFIGKVRLPDSFFLHLFAAPEVEIIRSQQGRIERIVREYASFPVDDLIERTEIIRKRLGGEQVQNAVNFLRNKETSEWAAILLHYYDKTYLHTQEVRRKDKRSQSVARLNVDHLQASECAVQLKSISQSMFVPSYE